MAIDDLNAIDTKANISESILKLELLNDVGFLQKQPTLIHCPACYEESLSVIRLELVTRWQKFLALTNCCQKSGNRYDINHYCSQCGCYIGRFIEIDCMERCISQQARKKAARDGMVLKTKPRDCAQYMQKSRENVIMKMAESKEARTNAIQESP